MSVVLKSIKTLSAQDRYIITGYVLAYPDLVVTVDGWLTALTNYYSPACYNEDGTLNDTYCTDNGFPKDVSDDEDTKLAFFKSRVEEKVMNIVNAYTPTSDYTQPTLEDVYDGPEVNITRVQAGSESQNEIHALDMVNVTGGVFTLGNLPGTEDPTAEIEAEIIASDMQAALEAKIGSGNVSVTSAGETITSVTLGNVEDNNAIQVDLINTDLRYARSVQVITGDLPEGISGPVDWSQGADTAENQRIIVASDDDLSTVSGTFSLTILGQTTADITWDSTDNTLRSNIQDAVDALFGADNITIGCDGIFRTMEIGIGYVSGFGYTGTYIGQNVPLISMDTTDLTGTNLTATPSTLIQGSFGDHILRIYPVVGTKQATAVLVSDGKYVMGFRAKAEGVSGNDISVALIDPNDTDQSISVSVSGSDITVNLATDSGGAITSTSLDVLAAIFGDTAANALVSCHAANEDIDDVYPAVPAVAQTFLVGGSDTDQPATAAWIIYNFFVLDSYSGTPAAAAFMFINNAEGSDGSGVLDTDIGPVELTNSPLPYAFEYTGDLANTPVDRPVPDLSNLLGTFV